MPNPVDEALFPHTIREINDLSADRKQAIYCQLIPDWVFQRYEIDPISLDRHGEQLVDIHAPPGSRAMEISVYHKHGATDPLVYLNMVDTFSQQLMVLLVMINDPESPRFHVDVDENGDDTQFGTRNRNIREEIRAMEAGLAPGQVRMGLRAFKSTVPLFEAFVRRMSHDLFMIEPLSYHNAVVFERYGFAYIYGLREMQAIHEGFLPGGIYYEMLDGSTPFRQPEFASTIRGRSWAIHDGILGHPFSSFQMYKRVGHDSKVSTFPSGRW